MCDVPIDEVPNPENKWSKHITQMFGANFAGPFLHTASVCVSSVLYAHAYVFLLSRSCTVAMYEGWHMCIQESTGTQTLALAVTYRHKHHHRTDS